MIAGIVTERVVDQLETIQIDVEQRELFLLTLAAGEGTCQAIVEMTTIAETRQIVDARARFGLGQSLHVVGRVFADRENS